VKGQQELDNQNAVTETIQALIWIIEKVRFQSQKRTALDYFPPCDTGQIIFLGTGG
jgi:hypothetical protein